MRLRGRRGGGSLVAALLALALGLLSVGASHPDEATDLVASSLRQSVVGTVFASLPGQGPNGSVRDVFLPDIDVTLRNRSMPSRRIGHGRSDLGGRFVVASQPPGEYELCAHARGYVPLCSPEPVVVQDQTVYLSPLEITPRSNVIAGRVQRTDASPCRFKDAFFSVDAHTEVVLEPSIPSTAAGPAGARVGPPAVVRPLARVRANNVGEYVIPEVPAGTYVVRASCEGGETASRVTSSPLAIVDLILTNAAPEVRTIVAHVGGVGVRRVAPGTTVEVAVTAADPDGDLLYYRWSPAYPEPGFQSADSPSVQWTVPDARGLHTIYVLVSDSKGGYALGKLDVSTEEAVVRFSGRVYDAGVSPGVPLAGAMVSVGGVTGQTNAFGYFLVSVPGESARYVLNIWKEGYQPLSKVFHEEVLGGHYELAPSVDFVIDPTAFVDVAEFDGMTEEARVVIQPNSLVDQLGRPPTGPLRLFLSTIDQRRPEGRLPGDYGAITAAGQPVALTSFGAIHVEITDEAGNVYDLLPGRLAFVRVPADGPSPPSVLTLWGYDAVAGAWREIAPAGLAGGHYQASVGHLSTLTAAVAFQPAAPVRVLVDRVRGRVPLDLRVTVPGSSGIDRVFTKRVTDPITIIPNLPPAVAIRLEALDAAREPILASIVVSGSGPATPPTPAAYPYVISADLVYVPPYIPPPPSEGFLNYISNDKAVAEAYYKAIDPKNRKTTYNTWRWSNAIALNPLELDHKRVEAVYLNAGDLGFGRLMKSDRTAPCKLATISAECLSLSSFGPEDGVAYRVSNHPTVEDAIPGVSGFGSKTIATVVMEYNPQPKSSGPSFTKFYVFDAKGARVLSADLDGRGQKYVPGVCMVCHGGDPGRLVSGKLGNGDLKARFIPFDLDSLGYSGTDGYRRADQEGAFKLLNERIRSRTSAGAAINTLITGWYGGPDLPRSTFDGTFVPFLWSSKSGLYRNIVTPACRSCHVTRDTPLDWAALESFDKRSGLIQTLVCEHRTMPHALVTWQNFWGSTGPHQPTVLAAAGLSSWDAALPCPTP